MSPEIMPFPPPLALLNPQLAQQPVAVLLQHFATALPWLTDAYGLVQTGVDKTGKHRYPQLYRQDGGLESDWLYPDDQLGALCFFEYEGPSRFAWADATHRAGEWTHQLAAVVWLNLPRLDAQRPDDFSAELALDFLSRGLLASPLRTHLTPALVEQRAEMIFQRYNLPPARQQLLMLPFSGFRIPFTVTARYEPCATPFTPLSV